jgi:hypothetical protein
VRFDNKIISRLAAFGFFIILAVLCATTFYHTFDRADDGTGDFSFFENRDLTPKPEPRSDTVLSGEYFGDLERWLVDRAAGRFSLIKLNTKISLALGRPVVNEVVVGENSLLDFNKYDGVVDPDEIASAAKEVAANLSAHRDKVESYGGSFLYVAVPCQYVCRENEYPWYLENRAEYTKASSSALFEELGREGIGYIDMYEDFRSFSAEKKANFTSTVDNHYSILGAYETYLRIMDRINSERKDALDVLSEDKMRVETVEKRYLGSRNRKLFDLWQSDEKLYRIVPTEEIPFKRYVDDREIESTVYSWPGSGPYATYSVYMGGDVPRTSVVTDRTELPSLLIYGDSFTNAVECIAWYSFERMDSVDLRYYKEKTLDEVIDELRPDYVICIRDYQSLLDCENNGQ